MFSSVHRLFDHLSQWSIRLSFELCKAYITSEDDILTKLPGLIENERMRQEFCENSVQRRGEIIQQLSTSDGGSISGKDGSLL